VWDANSGRELIRVSHDEQGVTAVTFSPDGSRIATASWDRTARVWDANDGRELIRVTHGGPVHGVAYSPDGNVIASAGDDGTARVWDAASGGELTRISHGRIYSALVARASDDSLALSGVVFSPDGSRIATARLMFDSTAQVSRAVS
jgi:WD40 repeat protein